MFNTGQEHGAQPKKGMWIHEATHVSLCRERETKAVSAPGSVEPFENTGGATPGCTPPATGMALVLSSDVDEDGGFA